ncbi:MAG: hypothetical protein HZA15_00580 [Nitrospirae bacterium]|nr:hypothetical protein [Nitrospirota bacterium]
MRIIRSIPTLIIMLFAVIAALNNGISPHIFIFNVLAFLAVTYMSVYIHEYGHVAAAALVGIRLKGVIIGNSKKVLWKGNVFGLPLFITNRFCGGFTIPETIERNVPKLQYTFFISGGLLSQLLLTLFVYAIFGVKDLSYLLTGGVSLSTVFIISNSVMILVSIFPLHNDFVGHRVPNDALILLRLILNNKPIAEQINETITETYNKSVHTDAD